jgi:hypothetical protein
VIFHYLDLIIITFCFAGIVALFLLESIHRKVNHMSTATDALTAALADLQTSIADMEKRLAAAAAAPVVPSVDDEAVARAATTVAAIKAQVDGLAVPPAPAA